MLNEEACPVPDSILGDLYRASPQGLGVLVETVPLPARAMLAIYCSRRGHLASLGLAIASTCGKADLVKVGGPFGAALFEQAQKVPETMPERRKKITLPNASSFKQIVKDTEAAPSPSAPADVAYSLGAAEEERSWQENHAAVDV